MRELITVLLGAFAGLALTVAGLAGVGAFSVSQRLRELGIRLALGAEPASVLGLVPWQGMGMVLAGLGLGLAGALVLSRLMDGLLFGVEGTAPLTFGSGCWCCCFPRGAPRGWTRCSRRAAADPRPVPAVKWWETGR